MLHRQPGRDPRRTCERQGIKNKTRRKGGEGAVPQSDEGTHRGHTVARERESRYVLGNRRNGDPHGDAESPGRFPFLFSLLLVPDSAYTDKGTVRRFVHGLTCEESHATRPDIHAPRSLTPTRAPGTEYKGSQRGSRERRQLTPAGPSNWCALVRRAVPLPYRPHPNRPSIARRWLQSGRAALVLAWGPAAKQSGSGGGCWCCCFCCGSRSPSLPSYRILLLLYL